ncbi:DUF3995 domain-containing protein [Ralstonia pickettii]|nr:DUF3995 domain-containing protein [Ralstonia pickettii]
MQKNRWFITLGIIWTLVFAGMSFYWALGGMLGARSLGGAIYEMALNPDPSFTMIVWLSEFIKLLGVVLLLLPLIEWKKTVMERILYVIIKAAGIFLFFYGLLNFITISLSALNILDFDLDDFATFWRLAFWEPYWMLGGIFYFFAVKKLN